MRQASHDRRVCLSTLSSTIITYPLTYLHYSRVYCSDECESLDATSPSISTTSSAHPSPYLHSTANAPIHLSDIPALVSSTLGRSLHPYCASKQHNRLSVSSSSASSVGCSTLSDEEEDNAGLYTGLDDEHAIDIGSNKSAGSFGHFLLQLQSPASLNYTRRPSTTNMRSTIPSLHRRASSTSSPSRVAPGSHNLSGCHPSCNSTEDDGSDVPPSSTSSRPKARHSHSRTGLNGGGNSWKGQDESDHYDTVLPKSKQNRASLPAYFSLLTLTSASAHKVQRSPSSLNTLTTVSRSLKSSPTTPIVTGPSSVTLGHLGRTTLAMEGTPRARGSRRHDAPSNTRSASRRSRSPRPLRRPDTQTEHCHPPHTHLSPQSRARLDSVEKVFEWVSGSPVVTIGVGAGNEIQQTRGRPMMRRNSSPPTKPDMHALVADSGLGQSLQFGAKSERRGRRLPDELDEESRGLVNKNAPGFGNGRSGLRAREERDRERERNRGRPHW